MKCRQLLAFAALYVSCCSVAVCQTHPRTPLFGGEVTWDTDGNPLLTFKYVKKGKEYYGGEVWLRWFEGEPALLMVAFNEHYSSSTSYGSLLICKNRVVYDVTDGMGGNGHAKAVPQDDIEVPVSAVTFKFHDDGWNGHKLLVFLRNGREQRGVRISETSRPLYEFLGEATRNFDGVVSEIAQAANLKDIERDLPASAHYHRTGVDELNTKVAQEREEEKEQKASQGGGGLSTFLAIATGAAAGLSGGGSNTPILQTANQQAAEIRAVGDANAAKQQAALQQQVLAAQQRVAAQQAAAANTMAASSRSNVSSTPQGSAQNGSENSLSPGNGASASSGTTPSTSSEGGSCTTMNSSVSATYQWRSGSGGFCSPEVLAFVTNNSSQNVDCAIAFHKNGSFDTANGSQVTVQPGQTTGGEWGGLWSCGNDTNQVIYSCTTTAQNQSNNCLAHVNWTIQ